MSAFRYIEKEQTVQEKIPDLFEQKTAKDYCLYHELVRPNTDIKIVVKWLLCFEGITLMLSFIFQVLFNRFGIFLHFFSLYSLVNMVVSVVCLKKICILAIEMYQHYAPEDIRRKCILMPTCSEYALLVLHKYNVVTSLYKIYTRLTKKCKGTNYNIDYP
jgi:putative component of membrane protein insertase Oxa1/YidC/SpoIIIJ protein YidD